MRHIGKARWRTLVALAGVLAVALIACTPAAAPPPTPTAAPKAAAVVATPTAAPKPAAVVATPTALSTQPTAPAKLTAMKFLDFGGVGNAGVYIANEKGFFKEQGIETELVGVRATADAMAAVGTGQVDAAALPLGPAILQMVDRGIDVRIVADSTRTQPNWTTSWLVLRKDLADSGQVKKPADLKGRKIAIPSPAAILAKFVEEVLADGGLTKADVDLITMVHDQQVTALANKAIDAASTMEPFIVEGVQKGYSVRWIPGYKHSPGDKSQSMVMTFSPELVKKRDLAERWLTAYLKGVRVYMDAFEKRIARDEVISIIAKYTVIKDPKLFDAMEVAYVDPNGVLDQKSMDGALQWFTKNGFYQGKSTFAGVTDTSFAEQAVQKLGKR